MSRSPLSLEAGTQYTIWQPADAHERFAPGAFDRTIGQEVPLKFEGRQVATVRVVSAEVAEDGSGVSITYEVLPG